VADEPGFADDESVEERAFDYARTVALSDGVFSIAMTLLVLNVATPSLAHPDQLGTALLHNRQQYESYGISFAVIGLLWVRHHQYFRSLTRIDTKILVMNLVYLAFVAFVPFPTRLLGVYGQQPAAVILYAVTIAIVTAIAGLSGAYARRAKLLTKQGAREYARAEHWAITPAVFLVSIPVAFVSTTAAQLTWLLLLVPDITRRGRPRPGS
jgi:uncharacterized membrane protein